MTDELDTLIIGAGPGGLSAGIYSAIYNLDAEVTAKKIGGTILDAHQIENYPGLGRKTNEEFVEKFKTHAELLKVPINKEEEIVNIKKEENTFKSTTREGKKYQSKSLLIATGTKVRKLGIPGEKEYSGKGVSYCAVCDAPLYKDTEVGVVGGSDSAAKEALLLSEHAEKVYIIYRGEEIHPEPILKERVEEKAKKGKIEIINNTNITKIKGNNMVKKVELDKEYQGNKELKVGGVFISIGGTPTTELVRDIGVETNESGEIKVNENMETNIPGVYAAGDVTNNGFKQAITAAYQGSRAVQSIYQYLQD